MPAPLVFVGADPKLGTKAVVLLAVVGLKFVVHLQS